MKSYEGLFIFPPDSTPDVRKNQLKNLDDLITRFKGQITQKTEWGRKPLGYAIKKFQEGYCMVYDFQMETSQATDFRKGLQLQEDVIKFMVTLKNMKAPIEKKVSSKPAGPAGAAKPVTSKPSSAAQPATT